MNLLGTKMKFIDLLETFKVQKLIKYFFKAQGLIRQFEKIMVEILYLDTGSIIVHVISNVQF